MNAHVKVIESAIVTLVIALVIQVIALVILIDIAIVTVETVIVTPSVHVIQYALRKTLVMGAHVKEIVQLMQQLVVVVCNTKI